MLEAWDDANQLKSGLVQIIDKKKSKKAISEFLVETSPSYYPTPNSLQVDLIQIVDVKEARDSDIFMNRDRWHWNLY